MKTIDLHSDTVLSLLQQKDEASLFENRQAHVDIKRLEQGNALAQTFAVWMPDPDFELHQAIPALSPKNQTEDLAYIDLAISRLKQEIKNHTDKIAWARNGEDIRENERNGKLSAILTLEDARALDHSLENIQRFYEQGFRMFGFLWNKENCIGFPNTSDKKLNQLGLKKFGVETIDVLNEMKILVDVSHLNDGGITDVLKYSKKPVLATHSNARYIAKHSRNLTDEHIRGIAESGGVIGLCFAHQFLTDDGEGVSRIEDMVRHLEHIYQAGGEDVLAIGTDFDGTSGQFEIDSPAKMSLLYEHLEGLRWPIDRIEKLAYKNALRVLDEL